MNSKQRVLCAIRHEEADRVPISIGLTPDVADEVSRFIGHTGPDLSIFLGNDILGSPYDSWGYYGGPSSEDGATYVDDWGITRIWISQPGGGSYTEVLVSPLAEADIRDLDNYSWPDLANHPTMSLVAGFVEKYGNDYFIYGAGASIFEGAFNLIGYQRFLTDLLADKPFIIKLVDILTEIQIAAIVKEVELGVDAIYFMDDPSGQRGMLLAPSLWREIFKPRYEYMIRRAKSVNPGVVVANHNCGDCRAIIPDWIEIGLQVLDPIQPKAMEPLELKKLYGDKLCFKGAVDEQHILPFGKPEDVVEEVKLRLRQLAPGGGYIIGPSHAIQADTSVENVFALCNTAKEFGRYPLSL
jgi:uroporphyrinogen decarboxylase